MGTAGMALPGSRSAIVVPIRLPAALERIRLEHVANARLGVPAHITLLFPFTSPATIESVTLSRVATAIQGTRAFDAVFREVRVWDAGDDRPGVVWLAPEPVQPFHGLIGALTDAFPEHPPYEGAHADVIPHLTVAEEAVGLETVAAEAARFIGFRRHVASASLLVEGHDGRWATRRRFALG